MPTTMKAQAQEMSSFFEDLLKTAEKQARDEARREALAQFLEAIHNLQTEVMEKIEEAKGVSEEEEGEEEEEEGEIEEARPLSKRALEALDFLLDHPQRQVTVKELETHLECSNAAANLALNELVKASRATKVFENGRAIFRPVRVSRAA